MSELRINKPLNTSKTNELSTQQKQEEDNIEISFKNPNGEEKPLIVSGGRLSSYPKPLLNTNLSPVKQIEYIGIISSDRELVSKFLKDYEEQNGIEYLDALENSTILDKYEKEEIKKLIMGDFYKMKEPFKEVIGAKIENEYYKGDEFDLKWSGQIINITNKTTGETARLDLEQVLADTPKKIKLRFMNLLNKKHMQPEILFDFAKECKTFKRSIYGGSVWSGTDTINSTFSLGTFVHELGHLIDEDDNGYSSAYSKNFSETFNSEMDAYIASGKKPFKYRENWTDFFRIPRNYATESPQEFFAESYELLMLGRNSSKNTILKYFPKSFEVVKELLKKQRELSVEQRRVTE